MGLHRFSDELNGRFSEMVSLFVNQGIFDCNASKEMKTVKEKTGIKTVKETKKLLGVMKVRKILLYTSTIRWYLYMV